MAKGGGDAESYRLEGNEHFRSSRYHNAISSYTKSLECSKTSAVLSNRAQAYLNTKQLISFNSKCRKFDMMNNDSVF
ncbi:unnamed protein product [Gongylonema pulchrum]|uniref:TPR_REGION domain-containing protein n=1 Tax=Gongylonema pulchrum TaxID=637853 RepID=A0A183F0I8_9BILA|nr:unnamed protein product [Gongylonema pulchrum]